MSSGRREILRLFGVALLLLPACLAAWYFAAGAFAWLPARLVSPAIGAVAGKVRSVEISGRNVAYVVEVEVRYRPGSSQRVEARVDVPAANYTYGFASATRSARRCCRPSRRSSSGSSSTRRWRAPARNEIRPGSDPG